MTKVGHWFAVHAVAVVYVLVLAGLITLVQVVGAGPVAAVPGVEECAPGTPAP
ncbi:hypothetical protein [Actinomadura yumaensis]|uniref:Uncharacterized protein n=1 Tax=Actinomadura yumaensis TaxID=111807 RepID=A0ABW2CRN8_9ACTN